MKKKHLILLIILLIIILLIIGLIIYKIINKTYTVSLFNDDGSFLLSINIQRGENIKNIDLPTKEGYIFVSWIKDGEEYDSNSPITKDIELIAKWTKIPEISNTFTVTFNIDGEINTKTVKSGECVEKPSDPYITNYKFIDWYYNDSPYDFSLPVENDITLEAKFEKEVLTITFDLDGGSGTSKMNILMGRILTKPKDPTKFGYRFVMWTLNNQEYQFIAPVENDITLKAVWEAIEYVKVKFDTDGAEDIPAQTIELGTKLKTVANPQKEGYTFKYWSLDGSYFDITSEITSSCTLKAVYEIND